MKAVTIHSFGGPEVLQLEELPVPEPAQGEVLVRVHAASVNPVDWKTREGKYPPPSTRSGCHWCSGGTWRATWSGADRACVASARFEERVHDVDLVFDLIDGETQERSWQVLKRGGTLISTLRKPSEERARTLGARAANYQAQPNAAELDAISRLIDDNRLRPHIERVWCWQSCTECDGAA